MSDGAFYELQNETIGVFLEVSGVDDGGGDVMGLAIVDGEKRLIDRVIRSERPEDPVDEVADDSGERQRGAELYRDYKDGKIEIMSADETKELVQDLKRKWSS